MDSIGYRALDSLYPEHRRLPLFPAELQAHYRNFTAVSTTMGNRGDDAGLDAGNFAPRAEESGWVDVYRDDDETPRQITRARATGLGR